MSSETGDGVQRLWIGLYAISFALWLFVYFLFDGRASRRNFDARVVQAETVVDPSAMPADSLCGDYPSLNPFDDKVMLRELQRSELVKTWNNSELLIERSSPELKPGVLVSSAELHGAHAYQRDAWDHTFCVFSDGDAVVVMSGGPERQLWCSEKTKTTAMLLAKTVRTKKLIKTLDAILAVVNRHSAP